MSYYLAPAPGCSEFGGKSDPLPADFTIGTNRELLRTFSVHPVTSGLKRMLESSTAYPLAIALAQDDLARGAQLAKPLEIFSVTENDVRPSQTE